MSMQKDLEKLAVIFGLSVYDFPELQSFTFFDDSYYKRHKDVYVENKVYTWTFIDWEIKIEFYYGIKNILYPKNVKDPFIDHLKEKEPFAKSMIEIILD
jgi:hypothetical protein